MSVNWVMLSPADDFVRLPSEQKLYTSPSRVSISLASTNKYPGRQPYSLASAAGKVFLTNRRLIYLPSTPPQSTANQTPPTQLASFAAPLTHLHDSHVTTPWLGPNAWVALVQPVVGGGIPTHHPVIELRLTFKEGGAYDFHEQFCRLRERLAQVREMGSDADADTARDRRPRPNGAADAEVNLEQLPAYEERERGSRPAAQMLRNGHAQQDSDADLIQFHDEPDDASSQQGHAQPAQNSTHPSNSGSGIPADPPPGYEEVQRDSVAELLESNLNMRND